MKKLRLNFDIINEIYDTIQNTKKIKNNYKNKYPNTKYSFREIIEEIMYYVKSGCSFRNLRSVMNFRTVHYHLQIFKLHNIFKRTYMKIINKFKILDSKILITDTTFINNTNGINKLGRNKFNKNKKSYKISFITDINGIPLDIIVDSGNKSDIVFINMHINKMKNKLNDKILLADAGYCSKNIRTSLNKYNCKPIISYNKRNAKEKIHLSDENKQIYRNRINVENAFCYLKKYKNISQINMKFLSSYVNILFLGMLNMIKIK